MPQITEATVAAICGPAFGSDIPLPHPRQYISDLTPLQNLLLRLSLSLPSELVFVDDIERILNIESLQQAMHRIGAIAAQIPVVVSSVNPLPEAFNLPHNSIPLTPPKGDYV